MTSRQARVASRPAEIVREYAFEGVEHVAGVTHDGHHVWAATGSALLAFDPASGATIRRVEQPCDAGTAFDGKHLWQIAEKRITKIDAASGRVLGSIPAPGSGCDSGLAWAEGSLWVGQHRDRRIHQIDPATGAILRTIASDRFVTGVTWVDGTVLERLEMPAGTGVSGLESDGAGLFYCGGGRSGKVRAVRRPEKRPA